MSLLFDIYYRDQTRIFPYSFYGPSFICIVTPTCPRKKYWRAPFSSSLCFPGYFLNFSQCLNWKAVYHWVVISVRTCIAWVWEVATVSRVNWQNEQLAASNSILVSSFLAPYLEISLPENYVLPWGEFEATLRVYLSLPWEASAFFRKQVTVTFFGSQNFCCIVINLPQLTFNWNSKAESQLIVNILRSASSHICSN